MQSLHHFHIFSCHFVSNKTCAFRDDRPNWSVIYMGRRAYLLIAYFGHEIFFEQHHLTWNTFFVQHQFFYWHWTLFCATSTCFFDIRLLFVQGKTFYFYTKLFFVQYQIFILDIVLNGNMFLLSRSNKNMITCQQRIKLYFISINFIFCASQIF